MRARDIMRCVGRLPLLLLLLPLLNASSPTGVEAAKSPPDRIHLSSLKALTFYNGDLTRARRGRPIAQMQCRGKPCGKYQPDAIACQTIGSGHGGSGPEWRCQADLPASIRLGRVQVSCEGWSSPQDEYILRGSCGLEYHLLPAFDADEDGKRRVWHDSFGRKSSLIDKIFSWLFYGIFFSVLFVIARSFLRSIGFLPSADGRGRSTGFWPGGGGGGGGWGGRGGGWWPGSGGGGGLGGNNAPPPPYSKQEPNSQQQQQQQGYRPGFWTGLGMGLAGLAGHLYASSSREREQRRARSWDWGRQGGGMYDGPAYGYGTGRGLHGGLDPGYGAGYGDFAQAGPSRRVGSTGGASGETRTSTGFGGTSVR